MEITLQVQFLVLTKSNQMLSLPNKEDCGSFLELVVNAIP
jgi:hypothetical protein